MYDDVTFEVILERMLARIPDKYDKREGSIIYLALAPIAQELALLYVALSFYYDETFVDTASDSPLELRCAERGITREPATYAQLRLVHNAPALALGTRFFAPDTELSYVVTEFTDTTNAVVECEQVGSQGNDYIGEVIAYDQVDDLTSAQLTEVILPGEQNEDTEDLRQRYFDSFERTINCGNIEYYKNAVGNLDGVGGMRVIPVANGAGTVKIAFINDSFSVPSAEEVSAVQTLVDPAPQGSGNGIAPIDHTVSVVAATAVNCDISFALILDGIAYEAISTEVRSVIESYLTDLKKNWADGDKPMSVLISQIEYRLLNVAGVVDITGTTINGTASNLALTDLQIPVLGAVVNSAV